MTTTQSIATGDRIYATETINFVEDSEIERIVAGTEGTVERLTGLDDVDLIVEWDSGYVTGVNSGSVAMIDPPGSRPMEDPYVIFPTEA